MTDEQMLKAMQSLLEPIKQDLSDLKQDLSEVKGRVKKIEITQENITNRNIQLLFEGQQGMNEKFQKLDYMETTLNAVKSDVEVIKDVVTEHSQSIRDLKFAK